MIGTLAPRVKLLGLRLTTHKPSSAEVKIEWSNTSSPFNAFMVCTGTVLSFTSVGVETNSGGPHSLLFTRDFLQQLNWLGHVDECSPVHSARFKNV